MVDSLHDCTRNRGGREVKPNRTQAALTMAAELRAYVAAISAIELRERVAPIRRRHVAKLAARVAALPIAERRESNRRAWRTPFDNRRDCH